MIQQLTATFHIRQISPLQEREKQRQAKKKKSEQASENETVSEGETNFAASIKGEV